MPDEGPTKRRRTKGDDETGVAVEAARQETKRVTAELADLRKQHEETVATLARLNRRLKIAEGIVRATSLRQLGVSEDLCCIEQFDEVGGPEEGEAVLVALREMDGCCGGRVLRPSWEAHGWAVQSFWDPPVVPPVCMLFGLFSSGLPDGANYRILPPGQWRALGCSRPPRLPEVTHA